MLFSVISIQGTALISQFILAGILPIDEFAIVRTVEATLQMLATVAPWGMSLLVVRLVSQDHKLIELKSLFTTHVLLAGLSALVLVIVGMAIIEFYSSQTGEYLKLLLWVLVLTSLSRTSLNYFYGKEQYGLISTFTFVISVASLVLLVVFTNYWQLNGWVLSRYVAETMVLVVALFFVRTKLTWKLNSRVESKKMLSEGAAVSLSLVFRSAIDNLPLLIFAYLSISQEETALYGLCTLLITGAMIMPSSLISVLLPRYGKLQKQAPDELAVYHAKHERYVIVAGIGIGLVITALGPAISAVYDQKYSGLLPYLALTSSILPIRAYTALNANLLFVHHQTATGTKINAVCAALCMILCFAIYPASGLWGVIVSSIITEAVAAALFKYHSSKLAFVPIEGRNI